MERGIPYILNRKKEKKTNQWRQQLLWSRKVNIGPCNYSIEVPLQVRTIGWDFKNFYVYVSLWLYKHMIKIVKDDLQNKQVLLAVQYRKQKTKKKGGGFLDSVIYDEVFYSSFHYSLWYHLYSMEWNSCWIVFIHWTYAFVRCMLCLQYCMYMESIQQIIKVAEMNACDSQLWCMDVKMQC